MIQKALIVYDVNYFCLNTYMHTDMYRSPLMLVILKCPTCTGCTADKPKKAKLLFRGWSYMSGHYIIKSQNILFNTKAV